MRGPIDYIVVAFEGDNFTGKIIEELDKVSKDGIISVLDVAVVARDKDGQVAAAEMIDSELAEFVDNLTIEKGIISDDDVQEIGELLEDNTSAGLLIIEHLWAKPLKKAILDANGTLIGEGRIHPKASKDLEEKGGK